MHSTTETPLFRRAIQQLRITRKIGIGEAAQQAGLHRTTLKRWEKGETKPRLVELESLLKVLRANAQERNQLITLLNAPRARVQQQAEVVQIANQQDWGTMPRGGDLLRAMRLRHGLSLETVAEQIGVNARTLRRWEQMEVWPSQDRLNTLCHVLGARDEETAVLATGFLSSGNNEEDHSLETLREQVARLWYGPTTPVEHQLRELRLFVLEARLWPLAARSANGRRLLAETYALHTLMLANRRQYRDMAAYSHRALTLEPKPLRETFWLLAQVLEIQADFYCNSRFQPRRAAEHLQHLLPFAPTLECESWLCSWIGRMQVQGGAVVNGLETMERACDIAARFDPVEAQLRLLDRAGMLLKLHQPARALPLLEGELESNVYNRADQLLTRAQAYQGVKNSSAAHKDLARAFKLINAFELENFRDRANALARQM